jgi:hypothetical protein
MLALNISQFEPTPLQAIEGAERRPQRSKP